MQSVHPSPAAATASTLNLANPGKGPTDRPSALCLRMIGDKDVSAAGSICFHAFQHIAERHAFPPDFPSVEIAIGLIERLHSRDDVDGWVAELDGRVVGSNFLWRGDQVAGVGPITIDPAAQNRQVGRQLMQALLDHAQARDIDQVRLVQAGYHMRSLSLYTALGFAVREALVCLQGTPQTTSLDGHSVRAATQADLPAANALCAQVHGHERSNELASSIERGVARVVQRDGRLTGYCSGLGFFGHAVCEQETDLIALIAAASSIDGPGLLLPLRQSETLRWCLQNGLRAVQPMNLMSLGAYQEPRGAFLPSILF